MENENIQSSQSEIENNIESRETNTEGKEKESKLEDIVTDELDDLTLGSEITEESSDGLFSIFKSKTAKLKQEIEKINKEKKEVESKNEELKDKYLRLFADFDNYKKRAAKERLELIKDAGKEVISQLLPVLDDFERAIRTIDESDKSDPKWEGVLLIYNKLKSSLESQGLKEMVSTGEPFNTEYHEALTEIEAANEESKDKVAETIVKGYTLHEKIIRYAKVIVAK